jgi:hypothetical protein
VITCNRPIDARFDATNEYVFRPVVAFNDAGHPLVLWGGDSPLLTPAQITEMTGFPLDGFVFLNSTGNDEDWKVIS